MVLSHMDFPPQLPTFEHFLEHLQEKKRGKGEAYYNIMGQVLCCS